MEVTINGIKAELGDSSPAITKKSIDINNPSTRFLDFTNAFILPAGGINDIIFKGARIVGANSTAMDALYDVVISDVFQIFRGKGYITAYEKTKGYSFQVVDTSKELFTALDVNLNTLTWDDYDTELTDAAISGNRIADLDEVFIFAKHCWHENPIQDNTDQAVTGRTKYSRPAFYLQAFLKRAIELNGYTYGHAEPDIAISSNHEKFYFTGYQKRFTGAAFDVTGTEDITGLNTYDFCHADIVPDSTSINIAAKKAKFRIRGTATATALIDLVITATNNADSTKTTESSYQISSSTTEIDFSSSEVQDDDGYTITIKFEGTGTVTFSDVLLYSVHDEDSEDLSADPWNGYMIKVQDNLPDLTFLDIFKLICTLSNKYQVVDSMNKIFTWGSFANLNKLNAVDWSDKYIIDSGPVSNEFNGLAKQNLLKYDNDITVYNKLGWGYFETDNQSLPDQIDYISISFGASNDVTIDGNQCGQASIYSDTSRITTREIKPRIFAIDSYSLRFALLDWNYIASKYYAEYFRSLYRARVLNCEMNLNKLDVLSWNEKKLVYIDYFKSTFIVLEIANFIPGKTTKVKLLNYGR